jgi:hypothetical protein
VLKPTSFVSWSRTCCRVAMSADVSVGELFFFKDKKE